MNRMIAPLTNVLLTCSAVVACGGCGRDSVVVSGTVTLDGKPVSDVRVIFQPIQSEGRAEETAMGAYGITDSLGVYQLRRVETLDEAVPIGTYRVRLLTFGENAELPPDAADGSRIVTLGEGCLHQEDFALRSPARRTRPSSPYRQMTTGKEPIDTKRKIKPRKTENDHLPSRKQPDA